MCGDDLKELLESMRGFVDGRLPAEEFADRYQVLWKRLRDSRSMESLNPYLQRAIDVVFTAIDDADSPIHGRSLNSCEAQLRHDVSVVLSVIDGVEPDQSRM
ncbi:hypothetical protein GCM10011487_16460 [Steroidobacter agaridevorans]|uniref:Colicin D immunity protein domain-containing protein n=1 Tax=Steroidobacter agaridevorans TaxID=2695856 RepID=A0A829YAA4_9GAMM|nr:colicin immunity domain-containing protein [Steroidobacter agaridevorans]GFE79646.1 hypothetical protein GCM10011487_16460 [Steroidobacter agaridevorans]